MAKRKIYSVKALKEKKYQTLELTERYARLMGSPAKKFEGMLKGDAVYIRELNHHISSKLGQCALTLSINGSKELVIPIKYLKIIYNED